jgi:integrase
VQWQERSANRKSEDWVFASRRYGGRKPCWGHAILRRYIRPAAKNQGIEKRIGWHTFRRTYATLLRSVGTEFKVMQELMRHSSYAIHVGHLCSGDYAAKHAAQRAVVSLMFPPELSSSPVSDSAANVT